MSASIEKALNKRWHDLIEQTKSQDSGNKAFNRLVHHYSEPHRHYHTLNHISDCLKAIDQYPGKVENPSALEFAIWFHDVIYDIHKSDNEAQSAVWAKEKMLALSIDQKLIAKTQYFIEATDHRKTADSADAAVIQDIDLAILGSTPKQYNAYSQSIRLEYQQYPDDAYHSGRIKVLESFLKKKSIYNTEYFYSLYEETARINLQSEIDALSAI